MSEPNSYVSSSHTVAELKTMCKENGLSVAGRKAELIDRLNELFSEDSISLEEAETVPLPDVEEVIEEEDEVLVAEFIEAEIIEDVVEPTSALDKLPATSMTLMDQIKNPKVAAVILAILVASGGWYWYVNNQLQPFTADDLRYGDSMSYTVLNGDLDATEGYIDLVLDNIETDEEDICRLQLEFAGKGTTSVTEGNSNELAFESDDTLLGAVQAKGAYGLDWLAVEKVQTRDFDSLTVSRYKHKILSPDECSDIAAGVGGTLEFNTKSWTEISERDVISTEADWKLNLDGDYRQGTTMSFGLGGVLGLLEEIAPGVAIVISPIEVRDMLGTTLIQAGANGTHLGWEWNVIGPDSVGGDEMWKVTLEHREIRDNCFGSARITMWVDEESPWAVKQNVDVTISGDQADTSACGTFSEQLADIVLPEGSLSLKLEMSQDTLVRGDKLLDMGRSYSSVPNAGAYVPTTGELSDWGSYGLHLPDNSSLRAHTLEMAVDCIDLGYVDDAVAATSALDNGGYIWRARDGPSNQTGATQWNLSYVRDSPASGWVLIDVFGPPSEQNCDYIEHGSYDNSVAHSRNDIPSSLNLSMLEQDLADSMRYPTLTGENGFFTSSGEYHPTTRIGHLIVTPDGDYTDWLNQLNSGDTGATTLDMTRSWQSGSWDNSLSLAMDATNGQVIGWNFIQTPL
jgi:hypothetical protein